MQLDRLLKDVTQLPNGTSRRQQQIKLIDLLNQRHPNEREPITLKRVEKWFERGSIPTAWLLRIAALPASWHQQPLNPADYA